VSDPYLELQRFIEKDVCAARLEPAIAYCERALSALPTSPYHAALGQSFLGQLNEVTAWLATFYKQASAAMAVKALYVEMTRFEINTDVWDAHAFAYDFFGEPDDLGWLCGWKMHTDRAIVLDGLAGLRAAYRQHYHEGMSAEDERAAGAASMLVTLRFQELIRAVAQKARAENGIPKKVPVLAAVHESDLVMLCYGAAKAPVTRKQPARPKPAPPPNDGKERVYSMEGGWDEFRNSLPWDRLDFESIEETMRYSMLLKSTHALLPDWTPPKVSLCRHKWRCDIIGVGAGSHWAMGTKAHKVLAPLLGETAEFLPIACDEVNPCWIVHPLRYVDLAPTAEHNAEAAANMTVVRKWAFEPDEIAGLMLFGLHQAPRSDARKGGIGYRSNLCSDRLRSAIVASGLYGVVFEELFAYGPSG
jgi:hypothetical protein